MTGKGWIRLLLLFYLCHCVYDSAMITAAKVEADRFQGVVRDAFRNIHRHLSGMSHFFSSILLAEIVDRNGVELGYLLDNGIDGNTGFAGFWCWFEDCLDSIERNVGFGDRGIGEEADDSAFEFSNI